MKRICLGLALAALCGCAGINLVVVNTMDKPIKHVEIKLGDGRAATVVPEIAPGASHQQSVKVDKVTPINVNFQNGDGQQYYASSPLDLKPGEGGSLRISVTAQGTLDATAQK
jgi:hypothetical protein